MKMITLKTAPLSAGQAAEILKEQGVLTNHYAQMLFAHPMLSAQQGRDVPIAIASLKEIGLENGATLDEILRQLPGNGLKPCDLSTGVFLRLAWNNQPESGNSILSGTHGSPDGAVVVLSEPAESDDGFSKGLYLRNVEGKLWLRGYVCDCSYRFAGDDVFAFEVLDA